MHLSTIVSGVCLLYKSFCLSTTVINNNVSGQHLLWTLLTLPVHIAPCSSCPHTVISPLHHPDPRLWDPHPPQCSHRHFSWDCSIGVLQVYEFNCHIPLSFQVILY
ncbi:hypothetical protein NP493_124g00016 [Ridgeia piscesae]|uniref:Secreted protein n=1 Tax=Ridgeia piscesae TaxID=27915 RepID=A0AAD9P5W1_RIDPI|nr:hypothetical protein NP493_124g00016 [Ridgeia piscesae]